MADLEALALARHRLPEWAAFAELRAGTGYTSYRGRRVDQRFDVAAFNCYPSKRDYRVVYEVKRTRSDFLAELDQPEKRAQAEDFFNEAWFVTLRDVCAVEEVPDGWGLLVPTKKGDKLRQLKRARPRSPKAVPYSMLMSVLRRACERLEAQPTFELDGHVLDAGRLEELVQKRVAPEQERLREAQTQAHQELGRARAERLRFAGPLQELHSLAHGGGYRRPDTEDLQEIDVQRLVELAARRRAREVANRIATARNELDAIAAALTAEADHV